MDCAYCEVQYFICDRRIQSLPLYPYPGFRLDEPISELQYFYNLIDTSFFFFVYKRLEKLEKIV